MRTIHEESETVAHKMTQQMLQELQDDGGSDSDLDVDEILRDM